MRYADKARLLSTASAVITPGTPDIGGPGEETPGAPDIGGEDGVVVPGSSSGPFVPATTGGTSAASLRLGPENSTYVFSAAMVGTQYLAAASGALGSPNYYRGIQVPLPNMPTSGDCWCGIFFRTPPNATNSTTLNTLLGVQNNGAASGSGGCVAWNDPGLFSGTGSGSEIATTAGFIQIQRNNSGAFHLWNSSGTLTTTTLGPIRPDRDYMLIAGISGTFGALILVDIAAGTSTLLVNTTAVTSRTSGAVPLFNLVGAVGSASATSAAAGFGGQVSDIFYAVSTFPTAAQALQLATGQVPISGITGLAYWNSLDVTTAVSGAIAPTVGTGNATLVGANILPGAPIRQPSNVTINRLGAHWVFPLACGAGPVGSGSGNAWIEGTAPAGAVINCQLVYLDSTTSATVQATADGTGKFAAAINSKGGKPFYRKVWPANGDVSNTVVDFDIMDVGIVVQVFGQSECERLESLGLGSVTSAPPPEGATGNAGYNMTMPGSYTGPWACYLDMITHTTNGYTQCRGNSAKARPEIMLGYGYPADGLAAAALGVLALDGYSTMFVFLTKSGHPPDAFLLDGQTITNKSITFAGSGTSGSPYTATLTLTQADVRAHFGGLTGYVVGNGYQQQIKPGSVSITWANGGSPVTVTDVFSGYSDASTYPTTTITGPNGASGTINNLSGGTGGTVGNAISVQFSGTVPTGPATISFTVKQETQDAFYSAKSANVNGWGVREVSDLVGNVGLRYGATMIWCYWVTAIEGEGGTVAGMTADLADKYTLLRQMAYGGSSYWPGYLGTGLALAAGVAAPPMVIAPKGRETASGFTHAWTSPDMCRQAQANLWPGGSSPLSFAVAGSWYYDDQVELQTSPHEDCSVMGAQRIGRRMAVDIHAAYTETPTVNDAPTWGTPVFSGGSPGAYTTITIPLSAAWLAAHPGLTLAVSSIDGSSASALGEWYVGGNATTAGTLVDNSAYATAALGAGSTSVVITAAGTTTWVGTELVRYVIGAPGIVSASAPNPPPLGLLYDTRGGFGGNEPGLLASPKFA
jgi:hypothetical protein